MQNLRKLPKFEIVLSKLTPNLILRHLFKEPTASTPLNNFDNPAKVKRRKIAKAWNLPAQDAAARQGTKRAIESVVRKDKKYDPDRAEIDVSDHIMLTRSMKQSLVLDGLYPSRSSKSNWKKIIDRDRLIGTVEIDLEKFSFLENPQETIRALQNIAKAESELLSVRLNFKDRHCLDVAPFMTLMECWSEMVPIFEGGQMELPMQKVLAATNVSEAMGIGLRGVTDFDDVWAFPLTRRRRPGATKSRTRYVDVPTRDTATSRFCSAMDDWLGQPDIGLELSPPGVNKLMRLLGEVLENAERHSDGERRDGAWSVSGFLARRKNPDESWTYHANIGILSIGDTFSESLARAHPNQKEDIDSYVSTVHALGAQQSTATLRTVCALQDTVTCVSEAEEESRGGYGLMDILDFVDGLGHTDVSSLLPRVTIISGSSCVKLSGGYIRGAASGEKDHSPRVQWFNKENSAKIPPDPEHVFDLDTSFPGTVISLSFCLDPHYLSRIFEDD